MARCYAIQCAGQSFIVNGNGQLSRLYYDVWDEGDKLPRLTFLGRSNCDTFHNNVICHRNWFTCAYHRDWHFSEQVNLGNWNRVFHVMTLPRDVFAS